MLVVGAMVAIIAVAALVWSERADRRKLKRSKPGKRLRERRK